MRTKLEDLDTLEVQIIREPSGTIELPAIDVARMIQDLRLAHEVCKRVDSRASREEWSGGE